MKDASHLELTVGRWVTVNRLQTGAKPEEYLKWAGREEEDGR